MGVRDGGPRWEAPPPGGRPRVIIIGAGMSGLAAGCYAQMSGLESRIFEKHVLPGGCCTAWARQGYLFDYCIDWLIGTAPGTGANDVWRELGALDGKRITHFDQFNRVVTEDGRSVTFYNDPDRLQKHLLELSPGDERLIRAFCRDLRRFAGLAPHWELKPAPLKSLTEKARTLLAILPAFRLYWRTAATPMRRFADRFEDPLLRQAFPNMFLQELTGFPLLPFLFTMSCAFNGNAGFPEGGSLGLARSVEERYTGLGGHIGYRARVERILVEDGRAVGVRLRDGQEHFADHVIAACDGPTVLDRLLEGRWSSPRTERLYTELLDRPDNLYPAVVSAFVGIDGPLPAGEPHSTTYLLGPERGAALPGSLQHSLVVQRRSDYADGFAPAGKSVLHCTYFTDHRSWQDLRKADRRAYRERKQEVVDFLRGFLAERHPGLDERIELVDVATPATTERYTGNTYGSILAWKAFSEADDVSTALVDRDRMRLPGLSGFSMAGQWTGMGGLIRAATSGRYAVQFLCDELGREFRAWPSEGAGPWHPGKLGRLPRLEQRGDAGKAAVAE
ncbi:phytoene desaturase family protein [Streptomyces sp. NBC_01022]|uniref:phytoene desaturase family protein n=1 Tax=Streptomyces sp. NBC_01022 TaxID=2903723 RepID=UPI002DD8F9FA|nr:NAD(P)/FAD-dependent oxidoreductase [Streptomyces sp. NBC_01022]WRZ86020.1 NAD(P)/FAD-dependent oxidoreductase [Streptomyces sp. NBC_01022]